jgi:hypothetical protein
LRNAIRSKFRKNRKLSGPYDLGLSFKAGYEVRRSAAAQCIQTNQPKTLDHLDTCKTSDAPSVGILTRLISTLPRGLLRGPPIRQPPPPPPEPQWKHPLAALPPEKAVLNVRPYAQVSGPRHVPVIASANGIPFLRLTKPQPPALSRVLRQTLERRMLNFHKKVELSNYWLPIAKHEDFWDTLITARTQVREDRVKWVDEIYAAEAENQKKYDADLARDKENVRRMQEIVDQETELALQEGQTVRRGRKNKPLWVKKPPSA